MSDITGPSKPGKPSDADEPTEPGSIRRLRTSPSRPDLQAFHHSPWKQHAVALLVFLVGYYVLTFPGLHYLTTELFSDGGDGPQNYWNNWWVRHCVSHGQSLWHTDYLFYPDGVTLLGATLNAFNGFLTIPLCWVVSPLTAYNLIVVFAFVVGGYTAFLLARDLGCNYWPSILCGAVFTFSPYHFAQAYGHINLVSLEWLPLFAYAFLRLLRQPTPGRGFFAAFTLFLVLFCDYYYLLFCILTGVVFFVHRAFALRQPLYFIQKRYLGPMTIFVVTTLVLCGPLAVGFLYSNWQDPFLGAHGGDHYCNALLAPLIHGPIWRFGSLTEFFWSLHPAHRELTEMGFHLGLSILVASAYAVIASHRRGESSKTLIWVILGFLFYLFSLGPRLLFLGERYPAVPMPLNGLKILVPVLNLGGTPGRMCVIYYLAAGVLAAFGVGYAWQRLRSRPRTRTTILAVFVVLFSVEYWPRPIPRYQIQLPAVIKVLSELPAGAVVGLDQSASETLLQQTVFEKPMPGGYIARVPSSRGKHLARYKETRTHGEYESMMREFKGTYLVRTIREMPRVMSPDLKCIYRDSSHEILVWRTNHATKDRPELLLQPEPCHARMDFRLSHQVDGAKIRFDVYSPGDGGRPFVLLFSGDRGLGIRISQIQRLPLVDDSVFRASLQGDHTLFENRGTLDKGGRGVVTVHPPKDPNGAYGEITAWACLVVFYKQDPRQVCRFSEPQRITLRW